VLSKYTVELQEDRKHLRQVSNPRLAETPFHSPQLTWIDIAPHEWVLYWRLPSSAPVHRKRRMEGIVQLPLFDLPAVEKAVGAHELNQGQQPQAFLHLVPPSSNQPENPMP
jgi:hypothetical protein